MSLWNPTLKLAWKAWNENRFSGLPSLRSMAADGRLDAWLRGFDAIVIAGGHGRVYSDFIHDPLIVDAVAGFHAAGRIVGLMCHSPLTATLPGRHGPGFIAGKTVTCWPRSIEWSCGVIPWLGRYLMPFGRPVGALLEEAGARVHDSIRPERRVHAAVDGRLVTARRPWSMRAFASTLMTALADSRPAAEG